MTVLGRGSSGRLASHDLPRTDEAVGSKQSQLSVRRPAREAMDIEEYRENRFLRLRFRSDLTTGSMRWTLLFFYSSSYVVTVAHVGTPENSEEGIAGLEVIARSFRFE